MQYMPAGRIALEIWQDNCFKLTERYLTFLGTYYAEDDQYVAKIKQLSK